MENEKKSARAIVLRILKIVIFSVLACAIMCGLLALYLKYVPDKIAELTEKGNMDNTIWLLRYTSLLPPVILVAIMLTVGYKSGYVKVSSQIDKVIIITVAILFTFGVMLPYVWLKSNGVEGIINNSEDDVVLMLEQSMGWFCAQVLPFAMALGYHLVRASSEKKEQCEDEEEI